MNFRAAACGITAAACVCAAAGGAATGATMTAPANDNFANAVVLHGQSDTRIGDTSIDATLEAGEAATVAGVTGGASVWYSWTAPADGVVRIDTETSDFDSLLGVYTGTSVDALTEVASNDDCCGALTSRVRFVATAGTTYRIRVDGFNGARGAVAVHLFETQPPANDAFAAPVALIGQDVSRDGDTNEGATLQAGETTVIARVAGGSSVWYSWTAPSDGVVTLDTTGSTFDTLLAVSTGAAVDALTPVVSGDDVKGASTSRVRFSATAGTLYRIRVDGFDGDTGDVHLHLHETAASPPPVNDDFANAIELTGENVSRTSDTSLGATVQANEVTTIGMAPVRTSVWYAWTAPFDGRFTVDTATSGFDTVLAVYTGSSVDGLTAVASNDDGPFDLTSSVTFDATMNTIYRIRVDGYDGDTGSVHLHLGVFGVPSPPTNVTAAAGHGSATVSWTAPDDGGTPIVGYELTQIANGVAATTKVGPVTQTIVAGLTNGTTYTFKVAAVNAVGSSTQSAESNPVTPTKISQAITVASHAPATATFGSSFSVAATAPGGEVTFSSSGACSNVGATFTMTTGTGTCSVLYDQGGTSDYDAAAQVVEPVSAQKAAQTITVTAHAPAGATYGTGFPVSATAPGGPVTFSSSGACSNAGATFTMTTGAGTCSVIYDQAGSADYGAAPQVVESVSAAKAAQAIAVTRHAPASALTGTSFTVAATAPGGAVSFSSAGACSNAGATFTMTSGTGTCAVKYDQAGSADYGTAPQVTESVTADAQRFTLTVAKSGSGTGTVTGSVGGIACGAACTADIVAGTSVTLTASASSGSSFTGWGGACSGAGTCTVAMDAAMSVTAVFAAATSAPARTSPKVVYCVVPYVVGKLLAIAKQKLKAAHCKPGTTTTARSSLVKKGRVVSQRPKAGKRLRIGSKVNLVVSAGPRPLPLRRR